MPGRDVEAHLIGKRYDCDECGQEMERADDVALMTAPPRYRHRCPNGHEALLVRSYPAFDFLITERPVSKGIRKLQPDTSSDQA